MTGRDLTGEVVVVTGGSSGIGLATCHALARSGANVVVVGKTPARVADAVAAVAATARRSGGVGDVLGLTLDVRDETDMAEMVRETVECFGRVDILVASAGVGRVVSDSSVLPSPIARVSLAEWNEVLQTNLRGVFLSNRAVLPTMIEQGKGWILNVSSARAACQGYPFAAAYCASKFGVTVLSDALAQEVAPFGVRVQALLPDVTETGMLGTGRAARAFGPALPPGRVAELVVHLLAAPADVVLAHPMVAPLPSSHGPQSGWRFPVEVDR